MGTILRYDLFLFSGVILAILAGIMINKKKYGTALMIGIFSISNFINVGALMVINAFKH